MGKALYRKYRSKSLAEIVGQEHITQALSRAIEKGHISHAYLFTGPRGVGKTSIARILAYEVNKLPYDESAQHLDIIEIDAASNRRIDEVRDLREKVHVAPTSAKYKVYIIDEVHMLTREAFNALLKTLEEPPAHVLFILATTEAHKLPETIVSRTQHFAFKPIERAKVVQHLAEIARAEGITISEDALELVAEHGGGSFRDSISLLDQVKNYADSIDRKEVELLLGIAPVESVDALIGALTTHDANGIITTLQSLKEQGVEPGVLAQQVSDRLQQELLVQASILPKAVLLTLLSKLIEVPASIRPLLALEISLLEAVFTDETIATVASTPTTPTKKPLRSEDTKRSPEAQSAPVPKAAKKDVTTHEGTNVSIAKKTADAHGSAFDIAAWPEVLTHIKKSYNTMYGVLRMAAPKYDSGQLTLVFRFPFHQKRVSDAKNQGIIIDAIKAVTGSTVALKCIVDETDTVTENASQADEMQQKSDDSAPLATVSNIFGGAELLES